MPQVNPDILKWLRTSNGLSSEQAARMLGFQDTKKRSASEKITKLEEGALLPSHADIEKYQTKFRLPLIAFYMSDPPRPDKAGEDFRVLPTSRDPTHDINMRALLSRLKARQELARSVLEDSEDAQPPDIVGTLDITQSTGEAAEFIKRTFGLDIEEYRSSPRDIDALKYLRRRVEFKGVFVVVVTNLGNHHSTLPVDLFRGIALVDDIAPFIAVNGNDARTAQSFTLLHELVHICLGQGGISGGNREHKVEKFCDEVASGILLDEHELQGIASKMHNSSDSPDDLIKKFAKEYKLSKTMIAYRLLKAGKLSKDAYEQLEKNWTSSRRQDRKASDGGGNYYNTAKHYAGDALISLARNAVRSGELTTSKAAIIAGVAPAKLAKLLSG